MAVVGGLSTFKGGHYFGDFEGRPKSELQVARPPKRALVPLRQQGFIRGEHKKTWAEPKALVAVGDTVKTGQVIARDDEALCSPVHSPISGKVTAIESQEHPFGEATQVVIIESDNKDDWVELQSHADDYSSLSSEELSQILYETGVSGLGLEGFPTAFNSGMAEPGSINKLVINAIQTEPFVDGDDELIYDEFDKLITGIHLLRSALGTTEVHIGIAWNKPRIIEEIHSRIPQEWCYVYPLKNKFPQGEDEVLLRTILGLRVPAGGVPSQVGALVCDVQQAVAAYEAVLEGKPFVERVVSVSGSAMQTPSNMKVRIGTPLNDFVKLSEAGSTVLGGVIRGVKIDNLKTVSVLRDTKSIVALKHPRKALTAVSEPGFRRDSYTNVYAVIPGLTKIADDGLHGMDRACVRCGYCFDVCPQNLAPIIIGEHAKQDQLEDCKELDIGACVECGLCSYVCPSKIPVMTLIQDGKAKIAEEEG